MGIITIAKWGVILQRLLFYDELKFNHLMGVFFNDCRQVLRGVNLIVHHSSSNNLIY